MESIKKRLNAFNQAHLLSFTKELSEAENRGFFEQLEAINLESINSSFKTAANDSGNIQLKLMPPKPIDCSSALRLKTENATLLEDYCRLGLNAIRQGKLAVILLSGGQGTRLGVTYPKGMYNVNLPSGKSLYQLQAERMLRLCRIASKNLDSCIFIPWYIMTSEHTKKLAEDFFKQHNYFGYDPGHIIFFEQFSLPALSLDGKILMKNKSSLCMSPDGNGGLYRTLRDRGILDDMVTRGVEYLQTCCVDNILVKMADPHFIGFCIAKEVECATKAVEKVDPREAIGVLAMVDGAYRVVEYSEISTEIASLRDCGGDSNSQSDTRSSRLRYCLGNICIHFLTKAFLDRVSTPAVECRLPYHVAYKKMTCLDPTTGQILEPTEPNAIKMEKFIFDVFPLAKRFAIWEVDRQEEFAPLKNSSASKRDCPETCRILLLAQHARRARAAGASCACSSGSDGDSAGDTTLNCSKRSAIGAYIEISPLVSLDEENLECLNGTAIKKPTHLTLDRNGRLLFQIVPGWKNEDLVLY